MLAAVKMLNAKSFAGTITVDGMSEVTGDAKIVHVRDTPWFLFDLGFDLRLIIKFPKSPRAYQGWIKLTKFSNDVAREGQLHKPYRDFPVDVSASDANKRAVKKSFIPLLQALLHESVKHYQAHAVPKGETPNLVCCLHQRRPLQVSADKAILLQQCAGAFPATATGLAPSGSAGWPVAQKHNMQGNVCPNSKHGRMHPCTRQACAMGSFACLPFLFITCLHITHSQLSVSFTQPHDAPLGREFSARTEFNPWD